jgi:uncharacterized protein DUF6527
VTNPVHVVRRQIETIDGVEVFARSHWLWCPGCDEAHRPVSRLPETPVDYPRPTWDYDGNEERPTFDPSLMVHLDSEGKRCHSYIRAGRWEFLSDCWHALAGQTVDLPPLPDWLVR